VRRNQGAIVQLYTESPAGSVTVCRDGMGPESATSLPGPRRVHAPDRDGRAAVQRATQELDYGRRGAGYIFGAFQPATDAAWTAPYGGRTIASGVDFLEQVAAWIPAEVARG